MKKRKGARWDHNGDGMFPKDRMNRKEKRYWKRWHKRKAIKDREES